MNQPKPDPMDQPDTSDDGAPRTVLESLMKEYENLTARAIHTLDHGAHEATPDMNLVAAILNDTETLGYLSSTAVSGYLGRTFTAAQQRIRASVESTLDLADMLEAAAKAARAGKDQDK